MKSISPVKTKLYTKYISLSIFLLFSVSCASSAVQKEPSNSITVRKLAIGITTEDLHYQNLALSNAINVANAKPGEVQIEIVVWGPALPMLLSDSKLKERIENLLLLGEIKFTACGNTMDTLARKTGKMPVLLEGVEVHQIGVLRVMELQEKGYSFLHY